MENNNVIDIRERILENAPETYKEEEVLSEQDAEVKALFESIKTPTALDITNIKTGKFIIVQLYIGQICRFSQIQIFQSVFLAV